MIQIRDRRIRVIYLLSILQLGLMACKPGTGNEIVSVEKYQEYPLELISYISQQNQQYNVDERISETYVEIDQLAYYDNLQLIRKRIIKDPCRLMVVLKSDAYGHGLENLGKLSEFAGADYIGITETMEIKKLRSLGVNLPIMRIRLASYRELHTVHTHPEIFGEVEEMVGNLHMVKYLSKLACSQDRSIKIHINLNTGEMSRNGFDMHILHTRDSIGELLKLEKIEVAGIMTHFANADTEHPDMLREKISEFREDAEWIIAEGGLKREDVILHVAATSLALRVPESHLDMVRLGSIIFGEKIDKESPEELKPVMSVYSSVGQIMYYPKGSHVGYGSIHQLEQDSYLANIPIGKSNGIPRNINNVLIRGHKFSVAGAMSMNTTMIDITTMHDQIKPGEEVVFIGRQGDEEISAEDIWESTGINPWDMHNNVGRLNYEERYPKMLDDIP